MITPREIKKILAKTEFKQNNKSYGFDAAVKGLGVVNNQKDMKIVSNKSY